MTVQLILPWTRSFTSGHAPIRTTVIDNLYMMFSLNISLNKYVVYSRISLGMCPQPTWLPSGWYEEICSLLIILSLNIMILL